MEKKNNNNYGYFTKESFLNLLSEYFRVLKVVTIQADYKLPIHLRIVQRFLRIFNKRFTANLFFKYVNNAKKEEIYQELFICKKK